MLRMCVFCGSWRDGLYEEEKTATGKAKEREKDRMCLREGANSNGIF